MQSRGKKIICWWLLGAFCWVLGAVAAEGRDTEAPYEPPILSSDEERIELLNAVRLTLDNDPNLLLRAEDVEAQFGLFQEQTGAFDWTLIGQVQYEHREQELTEGAKAAERDKRNQIRDVAAVACPEEQNLALKLEELEAAQTTPGVDITTDEGFNTQLRILEALINAADEEAERMALEQLRDNFITTELVKTEEAFLQARQVCSEAQATLERIGDIPEEEDFDIGRLDLRLEKLGRRGIHWTPFIKGAFQSTQFIGKRDGFFVPAEDPLGQPLISPSGIPLERLIDFGGKNIEDLYIFEVGFEVNIPLLRNRGRAAVAAPETAARIDWDASEALLKHAATESVLNTIFAYWNLVAAQEQVRILETSVDLQRQVAEITLALIEAEELPGAEEARALAGLANARAQLQSAARDLITARLDLVEAMGLSVRGEENAPVASTAFPRPPRREGIEQMDAGLVREALASRLDLEATRWLVDSGKVLARAAVINLRSRFDLTLGTSARARGESSLSEATDTWVVPSWKLAAFAEKPFGNNSAKGRLVQAEAQVRQRQISASDLERLVSIAVVRTLHALAETLDQLAHAESAATQFERAIATELEKLRLGETTLLDAILTEQQRTSAQLALVAARFQVATLIAQVRFETGTLATRYEDESRVTWETLTSLPRLGAES